MKKFLLIFFLSLIALGFGQSTNTFQYNDAPGVAGPFHLAWVPLSPTDKGYIYSIGYFLNGNDKTTPIVMWIPKSGNQDPIEVRSLAGVNEVMRRITADHSPDVARRMAIEIAYRLLASTVVNKGLGGFSLDPENLNKPQQIMARLRKAGLRENDIAMLNGLAAETRFTVGEKEWVRSWFEIDSLGSIQKITITGTTKPPAVKHLHLETVFDAGRIEVEILKKERTLSLERSR